MSNAANFLETAKSQKEKLHASYKFAKTFLQDDCGEIVKKLLIHLAIIILRGLAPRFILAGCLRLRVFA